MPGLHTKCIHENEGTEKNEGQNSCPLVRPEKVEEQMGSPEDDDGENDPKDGVATTPLPMLAQNAQLYHREVGFGSRLAHFTTSTAHGASSTNRSVVLPMTRL